MSYFRKFQDWLSNRGITTAKNAGSSFRALEHKVIERSSEFKTGYDRWILSGSKANMLKELNEKILKDILDEEHNPRLTVLNSPGAEGFMIKVEKDTEVYYQYLMDYLKTQVCEMDYVNYNSDQRIYEKSFGFETTYRHYLKPRLRHDDSIPFNQQYGNILIELQYRDDDPYQFKFMVTSYSDSKFNDPLPFNELLSKILK